VVVWLERDWMARTTDLAYIVRSRSASRYPAPDLSTDQKGDRFLLDVDDRYNDFCWWDDLDLRDLDPHLALWEKHKDCHELMGDDIWITFVRISAGVFFCTPSTTDFSPGS
jgi:hypothetical protein